MYSNGDKFDGHFSMGQIEGRGKLTCVNGVKYDGEWKHSQVSQILFHKSSFNMRMSVSAMERAGCVLQQRECMRESSSTIRFMVKAQ